MARRPCLVCGTPTTGARCPAHQQPHHSSAHARARAQLAAQLPAPCAYRCGTTLHPGGPWVAAHVTDGNDRDGWVAACRSCNEAAKTR